MYIQIYCFKNFVVLMEGGSLLGNLPSLYPSSNETPSDSSSGIQIEAKKPDRIQFEKFRSPERHNIQLYRHFIRRDYAFCKQLTDVFSLSYKLNIFISLFEVIIWGDSGGISRRSMRIPAHFEGPNCERGRRYTQFCEMAPESTEQQSQINQVF